VVTEEEQQRELDWVHAAARGDRVAFAELAARYLPRLERYALRILGDPDIAEDIAQEALIKLWQMADRYDPQKSKLSTWLHRLTHNACIDQLRKSSRWVSLDGISEELATDADGDDDAQRVTTALLGLSERQRSALVLTYYQGLTNSEVGQVMGLSIRAVESLLVRARQSLRRKFKEEG
jgi:RNA polymerase sigma-70 factor (ECF subfamily)